MGNAIEVVHDDDRSSQQGDGVESGQQEVGRLFGLKRFLRTDGRVLGFQIRVGDLAAPGVGGGRTPPGTRRRTGTGETGD